MKPEFILMLTYNDQDRGRMRKNCFLEMKDLPIVHWGFKDVGLPSDQMCELVQLMKDAGKTTYLEVVSLTEEEGLRGAQVAVDGGFDVLMGTIYYPSIMEYLKDKPIKYYPFPGHVYSHPSILDGSIEEIVANARFLESKHVDGMDLLTYRYVGDAPHPAARSCPGHPTCQWYQPAASPLTSALPKCGKPAHGALPLERPCFEQKFVPGGSFAENVMAVWDWLQKTDESQVPEIMHQK